MKMLRLTGLLTLLFSLATVPASPAAGETPAAVRLYVDPVGGKDSASGTSPDQAFRTLEKARDAARGVVRPWKGNVEIILQGGDYRLEKPFALSDKDSGRDGFHMVYAAAAGGEPVLDGGRRITGWSVFEKDRGIYRAEVPADLQTRQLFVNGVRAVRARSIAGLPGIKVGPTGYTLPADSPLGTWKNPGDIEFVYRNIWTNPRVGIAAIERSGDVWDIRMRQPGFGNARKKGITSINEPWYVENAYELLDDAGEWYFDRTGAVGGKPAIYYKPNDWENLATAEVVVPVLEQLVTIEGASLDKPAQDLTFRGLTFRYTTWLRPGTDLGLPDAQNNVMRENFAAVGDAVGDFESIGDGAALRARYARAITIERCRFLNLGGMGIAFGAGASGLRITGNTFRDISATGIQIGDYLRWEDPKSENYVLPADKRLLLADNHITNNFLDRCAVEYRSAVPIAISFPRDTVISHNEVYNAPYIGIHLGWGWKRIEATAMGGNLLEANRVQNTMVELADGACIYTLGPSDPNHAPTILRANHVLRTRWGHGLYFDESSSRYEALDTVSEKTGDANVKFNGDFNREISVRDLYSDKTRNIVSKQLDMEKLQLHIDEIRPLSDPAHAESAETIRQAAGLQPEFASARYYPADVFAYELEDGETTLSTHATNGMDQKPAVMGYRGMGYIDGLLGTKGASVSVRAPVTKGGTHELRFRYSAAEPTTDLLLEVNGETVALPELPATGDRLSWGTHRQPVELKAGENSLKITAGTKAGHAFQADRIELVPAQAGAKR
jgi:hypothetical protein